MAQAGTLGLWLCCSFAWAQATPGRPAAAQPAQTATQYRCDALDVLQSPAQSAECRGHVVIRGDSWLLCCDQAVGKADKQWRWQALTCSGSVRMWRSNDELIWADTAHFDVAKKQLDLQGRPTMRRGQSVLVGSHIIIDWQQEAARVIEPRGSLQLAAVRNSPGPTPGQAATPAFMHGPVPQSCPLTQMRP